MWFSIFQTFSVRCFSLRAKIERKVLGATNWVLLEKILQNNSSSKSNRKKENEGFDLKRFFSRQSGEKCPLS